MQAPLKPIPIPSAPMEITAMDILGKLPTTKNGNNYVLVFSDYLTKWPEEYAVPEQKASTVVKILVEEIIFRYPRSCSNY